METSIYYDFLFANLLGVFLLILGLIFVLRHQYYEKIFQALVISDFAAIAFGVFFVWEGLNLMQKYYIWTAEPRVIFTILSWFVLIAGILMVLTPNLLKQAFRFLTHGKVLVSFAAVLMMLGLFMILDAAQVTLDLSKIHNIYEWPH